MLLTLVISVASLVQCLVLLHFLCLQPQQLPSLLLDVEPDLRICKLQSAVDQNVAQTEEDEHEVGLRLAVSVVELAVQSVALDCGETPEEDEEADHRTETEEDLPASVLVRVDQNFDVHDDYDCCEHKVAV